jgi:hypothetical protein
VGRADQAGAASGGHRSRRGNKDPPPLTHTIRLRHPKAPPKTLNPRENKNRRIEDRNVAFNKTALLTEVYAQRVDF